MMASKIWTLFYTSTSKGCYTVLTRTNPRSKCISNFITGNRQQNTLPDFLKCPIPVFISIRDASTKKMESRSRSRSRPGRPDANKTLTLRPKAVKSTPTSLAPTNESRRMMKHGQSNFDYLDDIDLSQDDFEELADTVTTYGNKFTGEEANAEFWRETLRFQRFIRAKTLEQKYFKPPKKLNLLTWAAKEQVRFLHQSDPENWTIESLAKVLPIGKDSIHKIIRSRIRLRGLEDILKNDLCVKKNWETILHQLRNNQVDSESFVRDLLENLHSVDVLQNALPSPHLWSPKIRKMDSKPSMNGIFSLIVKDELEKQKGEDEKLSAKQNQLNAIISEIISEVQEILKEEIEIINKKNLKYQHQLPQNSQESLKALLKSRFKRADKLETENIDSYIGGTDLERQNEAPLSVSLLNEGEKQKSQSYRVDDCVYDENGEFLYRLP